jgi:hypothetical protein
MRDATAEADESGVAASSVTMLRLIVGWGCTAFALLNLAMGIDTGPGSTDAPYLIFHGTLLVTGLALFAVGRLHSRPGAVACLTGAAVTVAGLVLSALPRTSIVCCLREYPVRHGFPFTLLAHGRAGWHFDAGHAIADLIFWCGAGFLALLLVMPLRRRQAATPAETAHPYATHAEDHTPAPRDENVGGLP